MWVIVAGKPYTFLAHQWWVVDLDGHWRGLNPNVAVEFVANREGGTYDRSGILENLYGVTSSAR